MKPYSVDLRERIVQTLKDNKTLTAPDVAELFKVGVATVYRYLQLDRDLHNLNPLKSTGRTRLVSREDEARLIEQVNTNNDLTLEEHCQLWEENMSQKISVTCMFESLERARITLKKSQFNLVNVMKQTVSIGY